MTFTIGADHGGYRLKQGLADCLKRRGHAVETCGAESLESYDHPLAAIEVAARVADGRAERGVLVCTSGVGMSIAANRFANVRAALVQDADGAALAANHNQANVLVLKGSTPVERAMEILDAWLAAPASAEERHTRRVAQYARLNRLAEISGLAQADPEVYRACLAQIEQEDSTLNLIASENTVTPAVRLASGSVLTNKYAEGYPSKRWYGGCGPVDSAETLAIERAKKLFGADHANVQPHCGSAANMAVYFAALQPGDTIMAMSLDQGGHLTHGSPVNFSGRLYKIEPYKVSPETEALDYDAIEAQALACKPKMIMAGASAYARILDFPRLRAIADRAGALLCVDMAHIAGLVAGGAHPSPVPHAQFVTSTTHKTLRGPRGGLVLCTAEYAQAIDKTVFPGLQGGPLENIIAAKAVCFAEAMKPEFKQYAAQVVKNCKALAAALMAKGHKIVSGGTDNHLLLLNVGAAGLTGKDASAALDAAGIICNKNTIPFDTRSPFVTSGVRMGTASVTTRGMGEAEMAQIGAWITDILASPADAALQRGVRAGVAALASRFPVP